jgi:hypothetical protein
MDSSPGTGFGPTVGCGRVGDPTSWFGYGRDSGDYPLHLCGCLRSDLVSVYPCHFFGISQLFGSVVEFLCGRVLDGYTGTSSIVSVLWTLD